jgi:hypothetical protein
MIRYNDHFDHIPDDPQNQFKGGKRQNGDNHREEIREKTTTKMHFRPQEVNEAGLPRYGAGTLIWP